MFPEVNSKSWRLVFSDSRVAIYICWAGQFQLNKWVYTDGSPSIITIYHNDEGFELEL